MCIFFSIDSHSSKAALACVDKNKNKTNLTDIAAILICLVSTTKGGCRDFADSIRAYYESYTQAHRIHYHFGVCNLQHFSRQ